MKRSVIRNAGSLFVFSLSAALIVGIAPEAAQAAAPAVQSLGLENPNKVMTVTVSLNLRNQAALNALTKQIQTKGSPQYRKFLTMTQFASQFAPAAADSLAVKTFLTNQGMTVTYADKYNMVVRARGTVAEIQKAFNTQVGLFESGGQQFNKPLATPTISGALGSKVRNIGGLTTLKARSHLLRPINIKTGLPLPPKPINAATIKNAKNGAFFPPTCFVPSAPLYLFGVGLEAIYSGNGYPGSACGYDPADLQHAYGFDKVINSGWDGTGQTIVIVDAYGSATLAQDIAAFDSIYGLKPINLNVIYNPAGGTPDCIIGNGNHCNGWDTEVTLDVEYAHAMAPGATIDLVISPTQQPDDFTNVDLWVAENIGPASASHSYGYPEWLLAANDIQGVNGGAQIIENQYFVNWFADQIIGTSNNYSSGDSGDYYTLNEDYFPDVSFPAGSPNATSVGGTSLAVAANGAYQWENGWGNNLTDLDVAPPVNFGFQGGAGGGTSLITSAPAWQTQFLGNAYRQQPDIAFDADPYTGVEVIFTQDGVPGDQQFVYLVGGTSLASPMFSGVWAIAAQRAGGNLGNAAPILYWAAANVPGAIRDVVPVTSGANAHGTVFTNNIPTSYSQWDLAQPFQASEYFWESIIPANTLGPGSPDLAITFGTDSSLYTSPGWDNVTGVGTPNGAAFFEPFTPVP
jgi:subtilase family serine protease